MKYIYLIQSLENSYYKIGVSKHPQKRFNELRTGNPSVLKLITTFQTELANKIEKTLHRRYLPYRKEGEWFDLSVNIEVDFKTECKKIEEMFINLKESGNVFI